ncbi:MAG: hypothetical protein ABJC89_20030, partial [Acidobacteriota bacterium]
GVGVSDPSRRDLTIWLDNQLPPALATWVRATLGVECTGVRHLALQRAADLDIFTSRARPARWS